MGSSVPQEDGGGGRGQILLLGGVEIFMVNGRERQKGGFRKFNEKLGKKVQNLGIIFQIDMKPVYFSCICVFTAGNCYFC